MDDNEIKDLPDLPAHHIEFARLIALGMNQSEAYRQTIASPGTSDKTVWVEASKLANAPNVRLWINTLKVSLFDKARYSIEQYIQDMLDFAEECRQKGQMGAAFQAKQAAGKVLGYYVERSETVIRDERTTLDELRGIRDKWEKVSDIKAPETLQ